MASLCYNPTTQYPTCKIQCIKYNRRHTQEMPQSWKHNHPELPVEGKIGETSRKHDLHVIDPFKPHFYIVKLGFTGVYIICLISAQNHRLWVLVRTASPRRFSRVPTIYVLSRNVKTNRVFYLKIFSFWR